VKQPTLHGNLSAHTIIPEFTLNPISASPQRNNHFLLSSEQLRIHFSISFSKSSLSAGIDFATLNVRLTRSLLSTINSLSLRYKNTTKEVAPTRLFPFLKGGFSPNYNKEPPLLIPA
jgi:hypothetical protein